MNVEVGIESIFGIVDVEVSIDDVRGVLENNKHKGCMISMYEGTINMVHPRKDIHDVMYIDEEDVNIVKNVMENLGIRGIY
jgi:hypothetical protein